MGNGYPHSTIAQILEDIIDQLSFEGESHSNIADILLSILNQTSYDKEPYSVLAELFLKLKAKIEGEPFDPYDKETHSVIAEILLSILNETEYTDMPQSRIAELLLELKEELESYTEITVSGSIVSFTTNVSKPLVKLKANVEAQQDLHGYDKPWAGGGGANKMPDVFNPLPANGALLVEYPSEISFAGLYISFVFSGKIGAKGGAFIQARDESNNVSMTFTFSNLADHNNQPLSEDVTYSNELVHLSFSQTKSVKKWSFYRNWNPSNDASIKNFMLSIGNTATSYAPYENICPITGWSGANVTRVGVNVWDEEWILENGRITSKNYIHVKPNTTYFLNNILFYRARMYDVNKTLIGSAPFVAKPNGFELIMRADCYYLKFEIANMYGTTYNNDISLNYPSTDTQYHAYNGNTYTIQFGDTYYGGELDVTNGVLRVTQKLVDMGTANWEGSYYQFTIPTPSEAKGFNGDNLCSIYPRSAVNNTTPSVQTDKSYIVRSDKIYVKDTDYNGNLAGFKTAMAGQKLVFELATPFTIQLTPTQIEQLEENNIWADTGDVEVTYLYKGTPET